MRSLNADYHRVGNHATPKKVLLCRARGRDFFQFRCREPLQQGRKTGFSDTLNRGLDTLNRGLDTLNNGLDTLNRGLDTLKRAFREAQNCVIAGVRIAGDVGGA